MKIFVTSPSRLHFSLIDLNGELGRVDGGIGVALKEPCLKIEVSVCKKGEDEIPEEVIPMWNKIKAGINSRRNYKIRILKGLPAHVGLGSLTQLSLSVAKAIAVQGNKSYSVRELARIVQRGGTSGIGVAAFEKGGFILDGGHLFQKDNSVEGVKSNFLPSSASDVPSPPVLFQHALPDDWFFVVAVPDVKRGVYGVEEIEIFRRYCPIRREEVEKICRIVLMRILPSVLEGDIKTFAESLTSLQYLGFKRIEVDLQDDIIKELFRFFEDRALGYGMSSFGPATYAIVKGEKETRKIAAETKQFLDCKGIASLVTYSNANDKGSEIKIK